MDGLEFQPHVLGCTTGLAVEFETSLVGNLLEIWLSEGPG